jgi:hypothetical protein
MGYADALEIIISFANRLAGIGLVNVCFAKCLAINSSFRCVGSTSFLPLNGSGQLMNHLPVCCNPLSRGNHFPLRITLNDVVRSAAISAFRWVRLDFLCRLCGPRPLEQLLRRRASVVHQDTRMTESAHMLVLHFEIPSPRAASGRFASTTTDSPRHAASASPNASSPAPGSSRISASPVSTRSPSPTPSIGRAPP